MLKITIIFLIILGDVNSKCHIQSVGVRGYLRCNSRSAMGTRVELFTDEEIYDEKFSSLYFVIFLLILFLKKKQ